MPIFFSRILKRNEYLSLSTQKHEDEYIYTLGKNTDVNNFYKTKDQGLLLYKFVNGMVVYWVLWSYNSDP